MAKGSIKRITPQAYLALAEALAHVFWYKNRLKSYLHMMLKDMPEILRGLDFSNSTKREIAELIVQRLSSNESKYQTIAIDLMVNLSRMSNFPDLENIGKEDKREREIAAATHAVKDLQFWTSQHQSITDEQEQYQAEIARKIEETKQKQNHTLALARLREEFMAMHKSANPQERGRKFEYFLNQLFGLFGLDPRASYSLEHEQIDGAFTFDTDDYILEAKWLNTALGRADLDIFHTKINRKGRNTLGLLVSVSGFTRDAIEQYSSATSFITMEGLDIMAVLEEHFRLDYLLRRKKRHMNETGQCYFPPSKILE